jgi:cell division protein ZapA (FtsZ GTPase activity inhibitor)
MTSRGSAEAMQPVRVKILDREYLVRSRDSTEDIRKIAEYVDQVACEIQGDTEGLSERKTAILTALHIAGEYFHALKALSEHDAQASQRIKAMIYDIDSAMERQS